MTDLLEIYREVHTLAEKEKTLIEKKKYNELIEILEEKNNLLKKIEVIDKEKYIKSSEKPETAHKELKGILEKLKELQDSNIKKLTGEFDEIKEQLNGIYNGQKSRKGYQGTGDYKEAKFIDKKS